MLAMQRSCRARATPSRRRALYRMLERVRMQRSSGRHHLVTPVGPVANLSCPVRKGAGVQRSGLFLSKARVSAPVFAVVAAASALVVSYVVLATSQATVPQYQRRDAAKEACKAAGDEISRLRLQSPLTFIDDCLQPKVTPVSSKPGYLIVT